ncbi:MAG: NAD/NADP octopine/nopaline dehydrogenase family protein [Anaerolineales bacterium]|nr:NAD/NADP octopine/nopaline dehydrogenase family protein [Chloroflexota bacterium]MBL6981583.1 NAD/NADP octopine/nopaline dehydrogenase family protein [Anaerolineales bacterium]
MKKTETRYTVIGAGNGGKAMAAHLAIMGFEVTLYNRTLENIAAIQARGGITLESQDPAGPRGFGRLACVTSDMKVAIDNCDIVMVVTPAYAHYNIAREAAPYLQTGQVVVLNPGRTLGAIEFNRVLDEEGCANGVTVAEAQTFIYASRSDGPAQARIFRIKNAVPLAALPATDTPMVLEKLASAYPQFIDGGDVLQTGLNNIGAIFHPTISIFNAGWIEATKGEFQFYLEGVTPTVARLMEVLDRERVTVASAVGVRAVTAKEWLKMAYNADGENLYEAIHNQPGYRGINAPATLSHRYLTEDIPMSLVPIASLGNHYGVSVRGMESIIRLACIAHQTDYWRRGRTLERLGIKHLSVSELTRYVTGETKHQMPIHARRPKLAPLSVTRVEQARKTNGRESLPPNPSFSEATSFPEA